MALQEHAVARSRDAASRARVLFPGVAMAGLTAVAAQFVAEHYGSPAMLMALLFGIALNFAGEEGATAPGVAFTARTVLRIGVALLGARISAGLVVELGWITVLLLIAATVATLGFGLIFARLLGRGSRFALLTAGAVAICGASAAMAIAAVLPRDDRSEQNLLFTVLGVTVLSTVAMVLYPVGLGLLGWAPERAGVFVGATVHDVAQVVGAGFSISDRAGETATLVKLIRVTLLAPVVIGVALWFRRSGSAPDAAGRPPILPTFVAGFLVLATLNSFGLIPEVLREFAASVSSWALLTAIAAVGMKTRLRSVLQVGGAAVALIVAETLFLACLWLIALGFTGPW